MFIARADEQARLRETGSAMQGNRGGMSAADHRHHLAETKFRRLTDQCGKQRRSDPVPARLRGPQ